MDVTIDDAMRAAFWTPCETKEDLRLWVKIYLGVDLPDSQICDDEEVEFPTNSSPMDFLWEIYHNARWGNPDFQNVLGLAARDAGKTLVSSIAEILCLFHLHRDVAHLAANLQQSKVCTTYLAQYFKRPVLRDFLATTNERTVGVEWYEDRYGNRLDRKNFDRLQKADPRAIDGWTQYNYSVVVMVATRGGVNGVHRPFVVCDETELVPDDIYQEMLVGVPSPTRDGKPPIVVAISTRKTGFGQVQKLIDNQVQNNIKIRLWNYLDVTQACPPTRHLPHEPKIPIYVDNERLVAIGETEFEALPEQDQESFQKREGYAGCLTNCRLFSVCKGRLATKQKNNVRFLKSLETLTEKLRAVDPEKAKAQVMCWKPGTHGLIYPYLRRDMHVRTAAQISEMMTGEPVTDKNFGKAQLVQTMKMLGCKFYSGYDWGFTHNFAVVVGALWGNVFYVIHVIAMPELETVQKIAICDTQVRHYGAVGYPDPEDPASIASFRRAGYEMRSFKKEVLTGIEAVRSKILPALGSRPEIVFLADDPQVELLFKRLTQYHWRLDATGEPTDEPDDKNDDECDALRYICQNLFAKQIGKRIAEATAAALQPQVGVPQWTLADEIGTRLGNGQDQDSTVRMNKGRLFFSV